MATTAVKLVPALEGLDALHARELPQKDNLCGAFWASLVLRAAGFEEVDGQPVDQDLVALRAGSILPAHEDAEPVPPGESSRTDYRLSIPRTDDASISGTAASALARAIEELSQGELRVLPVAGPWEAGRVRRLLDEAGGAGDAVALVANVRTGLFWPSRPEPSLLVAHLAGERVEPGPADWDVGHFVTLVGAAEGSGGTLVVVRDTYASLGWHGYHLQPEEAVAAALERGDGREGGVLCVTPAREAEALRDGLASAGYHVRHWDNGTPDRGDDGTPDRGRRDARPRGRRYARRRGRRYAGRRAGVTPPLTFGEASATPTIAGVMAPPDTSGV